jgi:hypothetical protein
VSAVIQGLSGREIATDIAETLELDINQSSTVEQRVLRYIKRAQLKIFEYGDWPELKVMDASITTDASDYYDLSTEIAAGDFGRLIDKTVRCGDRWLDIASKEQIDQYDPERTISGELTHYMMINRADMRLFPYGSTGETVKFDYVKLPVEITLDTAAADISWYPERHGLIVEGALLYGSKRYGLNGYPTWQSQSNAFDISLRRSFNKKGLVKIKSRPTRYTDY